MRSLITVLLMLCLLLTICAGSFTSTAHQPNPIQDPFAADEGFARKMHPLAMIGSTPERKAAWEALTPEQQVASIEKLRTTIEDLKKEAIAKRGKEIRTDVDSTLAFVDNNGQRLLVAAKAREVSKPNLETQTPEAPMTCFDCEPCPECEPNPCLLNPSLCNPPPSPTPTLIPLGTIRRIDADFDGLPELFENAVADAFTPYYYVSAGEQKATGFATFGDFVPQTVQQVFGAVPPISNFRVKPAGFRTDSYGNQWGFLQLDYLTLWNRDNGLVVSGLCQACLTVSLGLAGYGTSQILTGFLAHPLDNERSAVLIGAPVSGPNTYNLEPQAYNAYIYFTAAHEDTFTDQSLLFSTLQPIPAGYHIELGFSRSKHGTYPFNPDDLPLIPFYIIYSTYAVIELLYIYGHINYFQFLSYLFTADTAFYACFVESFQNQGGTFAVTRLNVGDVDHPLKNSNFIRDSELTYKLNKVFDF